MRLHRAPALLFVAAMTLACAVAGGGVAARAATTTTSAPPSSPPPRAQLTGYSCVHAFEPTNRSVSTTAVMRPVPGTERLALRFDLLEQVPGSPAVAVHGGDLGAWRSPPDPTLGQVPGDVWRKVKQVFNLGAPANYQFRVRFRWFGGDGQLLAAATRYTRVCHIHELRPDLLVSSIAVAPIAGDPNHEQYTADIVDQGAAGAGPFEVLFTPGDGSAPVTRTVDWLGAHGTRQFTFIGPACDPSSPSQVTADSASQVDDFNRANNTLVATCPAPGSAG